MFINLNVNSLNMKMKLSILLIDFIDTQVQDEGYITTLNLIGVGRTATAVSIIQGTQSSGYIKNIFLNNDGSGYTQYQQLG